MFSHVRFVNARLWRTKLTSLSTFTTTHLWLSSEVENYQKKSRLIKLVIFCTVVSRNFTIISSCRRALEALVHEEVSSICLLCNSGGLIFLGYYFSLALATLQSYFCGLTITCMREWDKIGIWFPSLRKLPRNVRVSLSSSTEYGS